MSRDRSIVSGFLSIFSANLITSVISILSLPILVRVLGPSGYGNFAALLSIFSLYMILVSSGISEGVQKFVAEERSGAWSEHVVGFYFRLAVVLGAAGAVGLLAATSLGVVDRLFGPSLAPYFYLLAALVVVAQFRAFTHKTLLGLKLENVTGRLNVTKKVTLTGVGIGLVVVGFGVTGMLVGYLVADVVYLVVGLYVVTQNVSPRAVLSGTPDDFPRRELLSFNVLNIVLVTLVMSLFHVDVVMVRSFLGSEQTGYYKAALALAEYLWFVPIALETLLLHSSSDLWSAGRTDALTTMTTRVTRYTVLLTLLLAIGIGTLADRFIPLYFGPGFLSVTTPLLLLLPGALGFAVARPLQSIGQGSGNLRLLVAATGFAAVLNLLLNAVLIPRFGTAGAAVATSVGYGSMFVTLVWATRRLGVDPLDDLRPGAVAVTAIVSTPVIVGADALLANDVAALLVVPPVGLAVYAAVALAVGALDLAELLDLLDRFPAPIGTLSETIRVYTGAGARAESHDHR